MSRKVHRKPQAFTLIELLVVISVIAIMAAILFPVFAKAREKGRQAACISNEKQLGVAILAYTQDYDEVLPLRTTAEEEYSWKYEISPYLKSTEVFKCPSNPSRGKDDYNTAMELQPLGMPVFPPSYAVNRGSGANGPFVDEPLPAGATPTSLRDATSVVHLASIQSPSQVIGVVETTALYTDFIVTDLLWRAPNPSLFEESGNLFAGHNGRGNFLFMDGHVKAMKPLTTLDLGDGGSGPVNLWTNDNKPFLGDPNASAPGDTTGKTVLSYSEEMYQ
ncbi:hypothetical protein CCAX7_57560 [Capsulimonas corticalis]|uniref:Uncharacterized protein n=1 Tax=Capsulimonas corticalis TaxID=2219043 RepID=A0A402D063_9BACT|nr:DUF1559 domain-containing protein [Capsulimonas corticalis]BDI33705.1 hypothetical protein CCAX7_57560 [Capsulimonas corticalis]